MEPADAPEPASAGAQKHRSEQSPAVPQVTHSLNEPPDLDVAIIGGGPGGLAAAKAILTARPGLRVAVFERSTLRPRGAALMIQPNGIAALAAISPGLGDRVLALDSRQGSSGQYAADGSLVRKYEGEDAPMEYIRRHGGPMSLCAWHSLQSTLASELPPGVLHQDAAFERLEQGPAGVALHFAGGRPPLTARLVVGADGGQSRVRQQVLGDGPPLYIGTAIWRAVTPPPASWPAEPGARYAFGAPPTMFIAAALQDGSVSWQAFGNWPEERLDEIGGRGAVYVQDPLARREAGEARRRRCLELYGAWCPLVVDLIEGADPQAITEHPQLYRLPEACEVWGHGRVSLLGDAAHLATPFLAQGAGQALEDALALGHAVGEHGPTEAALRAYEAFRQPLVGQVHRASLACFDQFKAGGPPPQDYKENHRLGVWARKFAPLAPATPEE